MLTLNTEIEKHINKLVNPLKSGEALLQVLKLKLTKKELKLLSTWADGSDIEHLKTQLHLDDERYAELSTKLIKKLNQEKTKQEICI